MGINVWQEAREAGVGVHTSRESVLLGRLRQDLKPSTDYIMRFYLKIKIKKGLRYSSVMECLPSMHKALSSIPSSRKREKQEKEKYEII